MGGTPRRRIEVGFSKWSAKIGECLVDCTRIFRAAIYEYVQVFGRARLGVNGYRVTANDHMSDPMGVQSGQELF